MEYSTYIYHARKGRLLTERSAAVDIGLPCTFWITWERFSLDTNEELRENSLGVKKDLYVF